MRLLILVFLLSASFSFAQPLRGLDKSTLDIAYLPHNYAHDREPGENVIAKVVYSRPLMKGRVVFGGIVPYGEVWRTGANENTEIYFYQDVTISNTKIKAGTYSLFTIPGEKTWTIILNSDIDYWGAFSYESENDILRFQVDAKTYSEVVEAFTIQFEIPAGEPAIMKLVWNKTLDEITIMY